MTQNAMLWQPSAERAAAARLTDFTARVAAAQRTTFTDYAALWRWSIEHRGPFWRAVWDYAGVVGDPGERALVDADRMPGARLLAEPLHHHVQRSRLVLVQRGGVEDGVVEDLAHPRRVRIGRAIDQAE